MNCTWHPHLIVIQTQGVWSVIAGVNISPLGEYNRVSGFDSQKG